MDMEQLNTKIFDTAMELLTRKQTEAEMRYTIDLARLTFEESLDRKEYSNKEKREAASSQEPGIARALEDLNKYQFDTAVKRLEYERDLRLFSIKNAFYKEQVQ